MYSHNIFWIEDTFIYMCCSTETYFPMLRVFPKLIGDSLFLGMSLNNVRSVNTNYLCIR